MLWAVIGLVALLAFAHVGLRAAKIWPPESDEPPEFELDDRLLAAIAIWLLVFVALLSPIAVLGSATYARFALGKQCAADVVAVVCAYLSGCWFGIGLFALRKRLDMTTSFEEYDAGAFGYITFWPIVMPLWLVIWATSEIARLLSPAAKWLWSGATGREE